MAKLTRNYLLETKSTTAIDALELDVGHEGAKKHELVAAIYLSTHGLTKEGDPALFAKVVSLTQKKRLSLMKEVGWAGDPDATVNEMIKAWIQATVFDCPWPDQELSRSAISIPTERFERAKRRRRPATVKCPICAQEMPQKDLKRHRNREHVVALCVQCSTVYLNQEALRDHMCEVHPVTRGKEVLGKEALL